MSKKPKIGRAAPPPAPLTQDQLRARIVAAEKDFEALLERHDVVPVVEEVKSSLQGTFTRFTFLPKPAPPVDPVTAGTPA